MGRGSFKFRLFLVLYLLVIYVLGSVHGQNDIPTTTVGACHRRPNGFARDLENCASYFICQNGQAIRGRCPGNMLFDAANEVCWWREDVTCFQCPRNEVYALLPVQNTCFQFYMCWMGRATIHSCPSLLVFDPKLRRCNFPMGTGCEGDDEINEGCPPVDGANPVYLAHATSCTLYYVCSSGIPLERQCAQGLHFNPILRICDIPANANCGAGGVRNISHIVPICDTFISLNFLLHCNRNNIKLYYYFQFGIAGSSRLVG